MKRQTVLAVCAAVVVGGGAVAAHMTPWLQWTLLP
jgi:hypothetical protein